MPWTIETRLYESEEKSKDDDSIPDSFGSSDNQDNNSTRDNTDSSSEDRLYKNNKK